MKNVELKMENVVRAVFLSVLALAAYNNLAATPQPPPTPPTSQTPQTSADAASRCVPLFSDGGRLGGLEFTHFLSEGMRRTRMDKG